MIRSVLYILCVLAIALPASGWAEELLVVEADILPSAYSVERSRFDRLMSDHPAVRLRNYRRLTFASREDEIAYSLKTGNAPDVLSLSVRAYQSMADAGHLYDLSPMLLRQPGGPLREVEYAWTPMREADPSIQRLLLRAGCVYGFPGRPRIHGVIVRRSSLEDGEIPESLDASSVVSLAGCVARGDRGPRVAVPLDAELLTFWSIAEFAQNWKRLSGGERAAKGGVAVSSLQAVTSAFSSILHKSAVECGDCGRVEVLDKASAAYVDCGTCGSGGRTLRRSRSVGLLVESHQDAIEAFLDKRVDMSVCRREDVSRVIDSGVMPSEILFLPLAGAAYVPDMEIIGLYKRIDQRAGGERRVEVLTGLLKTYCSQFLTPEDSPLHLWHERDMISLLARRGFAGLFSQTELKLCEDLRLTGDEGFNLENAPLAGFEGRTVSAEEFLGLAGIDTAAQLEGLLDRVEDGRLEREGLLVSLNRARLSGLGWNVTKSIILAGIVGILLLARILILQGISRSTFRACLRPGWRIAIVILMPVVIVSLCKAGFVVIGASLGSARVFTGNAPGYAAAGAMGPAIAGILGRTLFTVLVAVAASVSISMALAVVLDRMKGWRVVMSFFLAVPACLAGFWGLLLLDAVREWSFGGMQPPALEQSSAVIRVAALTFAIIPFACMSYLYRLRRIDGSLYDSVELEGGSASDGFFAVTWPALEAPLLFHVLLVSCVVVTDGAAGLLRCGEPLLGGSVLRVFLFGSHDSSLLIMNGTMVFLLLLFIAIACKCFKRVELRKTYQRRPL